MVLWLRVFSSAVPLPAALVAVSSLLRKPSEALVQSALMSPSAPVTFVLKGYFSHDTTDCWQNWERRAVAYVCTWPSVRLKRLVLVCRAASFLTLCSFMPLLEDFRLSFSLSLSIAVSSSPHTAWSQTPAAYISSTSPWRQTWCQYRSAEVSQTINSFQLCNQHQSKDY